MKALAAILPRFLEFVGVCVLQYLGLKPRFIMPYPVSFSRYVKTSFRFWYSPSFLIVFSSIEELEIV